MTERREEAVDADVAARRRARRRAEVFGEVLPEGTRDDRDAGPEGSASSNDDRLRNDVPPHHG